MALSHAYGGARQSWFGQGTLSADGETVELYAPNAASATITITGTFSGRITATGANRDDNITEGGRLLFQSGVGHTGRNYIEGDFTDYNKEFRIVAGAEKIIVRASNWVSGTATISIDANQAASTIFVNGPVHDAEQAAVRDFRAFTASTGAQSVIQNNSIAAVLKKTIDSGVNVHLVRRLFSNNRADSGESLEYFAVGNPSAILANVGTGINRRSLGAPSASAFEWGVDTTANLGQLGGFLGTGEILPRGAPYTRDFEVILAPGRGFGVIIQGAGNNVNNAVRVGITLEWYEEAI